MTEGNAPVVEPQAESQTPKTDPRKEAPPEAGLELVLLMAAAEPQYQEALQKDRSGALAAVAATDVRLSPNERRILETVGDRALRDMAEQVSSRLTDDTRRAFMQRALMALGALGMAGVACKEDGNAITAPPPFSQGHSGTMEPTQRGLRESNEGLGNAPGAQGGAAAEEARRSGMEIRREFAREGGLGGIRPRSRPKVRLGTVTCEGFCNVQEATRVLRRHLPEVQYGYISIALPEDPTFEATLRVDFSLSNAGKPFLVRIAQGRPDALPKFTDMLIDSFHRWKFPRDTRGTKAPCLVTATYHFELGKM